MLLEKATMQKLGLLIFGACCFGMGWIAKSSHDLHEDIRNEAPEGLFVNRVTDEVVFAIGLRALQENVFDNCELSEIIQDIN